MERLKWSIHKVMKNGAQAFTLIELLIVIGILGVLAVTVLLTLNPAEAQRKARDVQRSKDAATLQSVLEQALNDGLRFPNCDAAGEVCQSSFTGATNNVRSVVAQQPCAAAGNWLAAEAMNAAGTWVASSLCNYAKSIPADPQNGRLSRCVQTAAGAQPATAVCEMEYYANTIGLDYEIVYKIESTANRAKLNDGGAAANFHVELFTGLSNLVGNGDASGNF